MALTIPADEAIGLLLPMLIVADGFSVAAHWRGWDGPVALRLILAAVVGIAFGSLVLSALSETVLRNVIAVATLLFVVAFAWLRRGGTPPLRASSLGVVAGATSGLTSTLAHIGGPPIVMYLMSVRLSPVRLVATSVAFFAVVNLLKVPGYLVAGLFDPELIVSTAWVWPLIPGGVWLGRRMVGRIDRDRFDRITLVLLAAGAVVLLVT